jgi:UDP-glucose:(heptosyl)LPS alpha-1,3-glucosyltransferase
LAQEREVFARGKPTQVLLVAARERQRFIDHYGTEGARLHLLPPGLERELIHAPLADDAQRQTRKQELGLPPDAGLLLLVATHFDTKGVDRALRALAALPAGQRENSYLVVVGGDDPRSYLRLANRLGVAGRVRFVGAQRQVANFYRAADLLLHPAYVENTGNTLLEAMACGLPVLATAVCGYAWHVQQANGGLICPSPFRQRRLNQLLRHMLASPQMPDWRLNGRRYCERQELHGMADQAAEIILDRAGGRRAA